MRTLLLQNPWVQFYLLYVGVLVIVLVWDRLLNPPASRGGKKTPRPVSKPAPRTVQEVEPFPGARWLQAPTDSIAAPPQGIAGRAPARVRRAPAFASFSPSPSLEDLR
jgi:hypothetical protein